MGRNLTSNLPITFRTRYLMSFADDNNPYRSTTWGEIAAHAAVDERADFIRKTYAHLLGAILAFAVLETFLINFVAESVVPQMLGGPYSWLIVLGAFMLVSWVANYWAQSSTSMSMQYAGLTLYVIAEAVIFMPLLYLVDKFFPGQHIIPTAGAITLILFAGLTAVVFMTRADFSWLRSVLWIAGLAAMGAIVLSIFMGFQLGILFTTAMIAFACGWILYDTSMVLQHYRVNQHVAAALALFASVALLFWYVIRFVMQYMGED